MNPLVPALGGMMLCSISSSIAMMMGGEEETPNIGAGPGSSGADDTEFVNECTEGECPTLRNAAGLKLVVQGDGNLVLYDAGGQPLWNTATYGQGVAPYRLVLQGDGNLVLYDTNSTALWNTGTYGQGVAPYRLVLQNDHNLVLYDAGGQPLWSSGTQV